MFAVYLIVTGILLGNVGWWRWADNRVRRLRGGLVWRSLVAAFVGSQLAYLIYFMTAPRSARQAHPWLPVPFVAGFYVWSLILLPVTLLGIGLQRVASIVRRRVRPTAPATGVSRRQVLSAVAVAAPPLLAAAAVGRAMPQLRQFRIRRLHLRVPGLPLGLDGLTIAHVSDLHLGRFTRPGFPEKVADATNALRADLVLFTGDLIDLSINDLPRGIDFLHRLDPRHGVGIIEGNHDLIEDPDAFDQALMSAGLPLLVDQTMTVRVRGERLQLLGGRWGAATGDRRRAKPADFAASVAALAPLRDPAAFPILMAHHPHAWDPAATAGFPLVLSGHTHGGQLMLTDHLGGGPAFYRYWSGPYGKGDSQLVVSNGVGN